jgi:Short C-terminal domain
MPSPAWVCRPGPVLTMEGSVAQYNHVALVVILSIEWLVSNVLASLTSLQGHQLRRFAALREAGALSEREFAQKKADLLSRV